MAACKILLLHDAIFKKKSNLYYTHGITPKRVTSGRVHLGGLAPGQHSSEGTSQWWRVVVDTVFNLTAPGIEPQISSAQIKMYFTTTLISRNIPCKSKISTRVFQRPGYATARLNLRLQNE